MRIFYLPKFARQYKKLSIQVKQLAKEKEEIFRKNPFDSRLKTHKLGGALTGLWALRIDYSHRIIFEFVEADVVRFYAIGDHNIYE